MFAVRILERLKVTYTSAMFVKGFQGHYRFQIYVISIKQYACINGIAVLIISCFGVVLYFFLLLFFVCIFVRTIQISDILICVRIFINIFGSQGFSVYVERAETLG